MLGFVWSKNTKKILELNSCGFGKIIAFLYSFEK